MTDFFLLLERFLDQQLMEETDITRTNKLQKKFKLALTITITEGPLPW